MSLVRIDNQLENESFDDYHRRLKKILDNRRYNQTVTSEDMVRDRLAFGVFNPKLKEHFVKEDPDTLTLNKLI